MTTTTTTPSELPALDLALKTLWGASRWPGSEPGGTIYAHPAWQQALRRFDQLAGVHASGILHGPHGAGKSLLIHHWSERLTYESREVYRVPRLQGPKAQIDYRHVITWLVRKPGAFRGYIYREELFPTVVFRQAYDRLCAAEDAAADLRYLHLLELAADQGEAVVAEVLGGCLRAGQVPHPDLVRARLSTAPDAPSVVAAFTPDLKGYDSLLTEVSA